MAKLSARHAAIAQPVERILGKDEVASSNLASSSIKKPRTSKGFRLSYFLQGVVAIKETDTETDTMTKIQPKEAAILCLPKL